MQFKITFFLDIQVNVVSKHLHFNLASN